MLYLAGFLLCVPIGLAKLCLLVPRRISWGLLARGLRVGCAAIPPVGWSGRKLVAGCTVRDGIDAMLVVLGSGSVQLAGPCAYCLRIAC